MALNGVVSVGIGMHGGTPAILVGVETSAHLAQSGIPDSLEGHPVHGFVAGTPTAF